MYIPLPPESQWLSGKSVCLVIRRSWVQKSQLDAEFSDDFGILTGAIQRGGMSISFIHCIFMMVKVTRCFPSKFMEITRTELVAKCSIVKLEYVSSSATMFFHYLSLSLVHFSKPRGRYFIFLSLEALTLHCIFLSLEAVVCTLLSREAVTLFF